MLILILKSNLKTQEKVDEYSPLFNLHPAIQKWTIDLEDIDNVLRLETNHDFDLNSFSKLVNEYGINVVELS